MIVETASSSSSPFFPVFMIAFLSFHSLCKSDLFNSAQPLHFHFTSFEVQELLVHMYSYLYSISIWGLCVVANHSLVSFFLLLRLLVLLGFWSTSSPRKHEGLESSLPS